MNKLLEEFNTAINQLVEFSEYIERMESDSSLIFQQKFRNFQAIITKFDQIHTQMQQKLESREESLAKKCKGVVYTIRTIIKDVRGEINDISTKRKSNIECIDNANDHLDRLSEAIVICDPEP